MLINAPAMATPVLLSAKSVAAATYQSTAVDITDFDGAVSIEQVLVSLTGAQTEAAIIQTADDSGFTLNVSTVATFTTYTQSDLVRLQRISVDVNACRRYLRVNATLAGSTPAISSAYVLNGIKKVMP